MTKSQQQLAIEKTKGPCIIKAGAGTGKTFTIVEKIAYILNKGICKPSEILCLTFSNVATNNLRNQVQEKVPTKASEITIRTFHGFCTDVLKEFGSLINIDHGFEILLPEDAKVWFYRDLGIRPYDADLYVKSISTAKDFGISLFQIEEHVKKLRENLGSVKDPDKKAEELELEFNTLHLKPKETKEQRKAVSDRKKEISQFLEAYSEYARYRNFAAAWKKYNELKQEKNVLDFADLNFNVLQLFEKFGHKRVAEKYSYVLVDEFQDTNKLQFELIESIAKDHKNITVVGDPNQTIYGFRGAYRESFNHFTEAFEVNPKTDEFKLDKSRRSPNTVLRVSHQLIKNNYEDKKECILVENEYKINGNKIETIELKHGNEEARKVAELVEKEITEGTPLDEICVLFRTHAQGKMIRQALEAKNIPIIAAGRTDMMMRPEIKTAIAYLSILNNMIERTGTGEQAWWNLFHYHNALSPEDTVRIGRYLKKNRDDKISIDEALLNSLSHIELSESGKKIVHRVVSKLKELMKSSNKPLPDLILDIYEITGLNRAFTHTRSVRNVEALMNLKQFYDIAENYYKNHSKELGSFIGYIEILDELGVEIEASKIEDVNAVRIMTMHAVKGLEFKAVIVTNLAEDRFPITRTHKEPLIPKELNPDIKRHLESLGKLTEEQKEEAIKDYERQTMIYEERRLCYVAFTRAKERLVLTFARSYNNEPDSTLPSLFLDEIEFKDNKDISLAKDDEEKCTIFAPSSRFEEFKSLLKKQLMSSLDSDDFPVLLSRLVAYHAAREGKIEDYAKLVDWKKIVDKKELESHIKICASKSSCLRFNKESFTFSPTAALDYDDCPKKYELRHIFQMPERGVFGFGAADTGTFVHELLETGVKEGFDSKEKFISKAKEMAADWVDLKEVNKLISVFWERHKGRYDKNTKVEAWLDVELNGFRFTGKADRIDFISDKDVEIIDYKTGKSDLNGNKRTWQLGFYGIAAKKKYGWNPARLTLEMLKKEKPYEAEPDENGVWKSLNTKFTLEQVEKELVECAKKIVHDYETAFMPSETDKPCENCGYRFYCPKWEEE